MVRSSRSIVGSLTMICTALLLVFATSGHSQSPVEAPTGFDDQTNGMVTQDVHDQDRKTFFDEVDDATNGLGPVFNSTSCAGCHSNPKDGAISEITELRAGHLDSSGQFENPTIPINHGKNTITGRSLINQMAICKAVQEVLPASETIRTFRTTVNTLGDGFVEAIDDQTLLDIADRQVRRTNGVIHGQAINVPVVEAPGTTRVGRFGWKDQHGSLLSFAGDAYLNEQGITSRLFPTDVTPICDTASDPEDKTGADGLADIDHFAQFIRASKAPSVDAVAAAKPDAQAGSALFDQLGCSTCHVRSIQTAPPGTFINGGTFRIPRALGNKVIHPFSDFLLHDVGTGDGIVQNGPPSTASELRTPPLWGVRFRVHLMHDAQSLSRNDAILRHAGEAAAVTRRYRSLTNTQKSQLLAFLNSL